MTIKKIVRIDEGPMDFIRGAGAEAGRKISNSAPVRAGREIYQAGKQASAEGDARKQQAMADDLIQQISILAQDISAYDEMKGIPQDEHPEDEKSTNDAEADNGQQPQQQQTDNIQQGARSPGGVADAFRTTQKPKGRATGGHDFQWSFDSYLRLLHNTETQLDEGAWDFVKGAGVAAVDKVRGQINKFAQKPSVFKDMYQAGKKASQEGDIKNKALKQLRKVIQMIVQLGPVGETAFKRGISSLPKQSQRRIETLINSNLGRQQPPVQSQSSA